MLALFIVLGLATTGVGGLIPLAQNLLSRPSLRRLFAFRSGILVAVTFLDILTEAWKFHPTLAGTGAMGAFTASSCRALCEARPARAAAAMAMGPL